MSVNRERQDVITCRGPPRNRASCAPSCNTLLSTDSSTSTTTQPGLEDVAPPCPRIIATGQWARATKVAAVEPTRPSVKCSVRSTRHQHFRPQGRIHQRTGWVALQYLHLDLDRLLG
jgi:hypothetical protein